MSWVALWLGGIVLNKQAPDWAVILSALVLAGIFSWLVAGAGWEAWVALLATVAGAVMVVLALLMFAWLGAPQDQRRFILPTVRKTVASDWLKLKLFFGIR
jgi:hypothetical protein